MASLKILCRRHRGDDLIEETLRLPLTVAAYRLLFPWLPGPAYERGHRRIDGVVVAHGFSVSQSLVDEIRAFRTKKPIHQQPFQTRSRIIKAAADPRPRGGGPRHPRRKGLFPRETASPVRGRLSGRGPIETFALHVLQVRAEDLHNLLPVAKIPLLSRCSLAERSLERTLS